MCIQNNRRGFINTLAFAGLAVSFHTPANCSGAENVSLYPASLVPDGDWYIDPKKVLLHECTRREVRELLDSGQLKAAIIPAGATEQHNKHMAMIMDTAGALLVSQLAALRLYPGVIVTPPVSVGVSPHWMDRKGTLTLRKETFQNVIVDMCDSLYVHGFRTILIVEGHGRKALEEIVPVIRSKLGITVETCGYWDGISEDEGKQILDSEWIPGITIPDHAGEWETSIALAGFPDRVRYPRDTTPPPVKESPERKAALDMIGFYRAEFDTPELDQWFFEGSKKATAEKGERIIALCVSFVARTLESMMSR